MLAEDRSSFVAALDHANEAQRARVDHHVAMLAGVLGALERLVEGGPSLAELATLDPVAAAAARPRWEAIVRLAQRQLGDARNGDGASVRAPLGTAKGRP